MSPQQGHARSAPTPSPRWANGRGEHAKQIATKRPWGEGGGGMSRWWRRRTRGVAGEKAVKMPHKQGGRGIPAPNPPVHRRDVFIKQTYVHIARYGEGRGVRMGAAVAAEMEAGGGGEEGGGAPAARRGASPRLPPPPWRQGRGGREQAARTFTVFTQVKGERARTEKAVAISLAISPTVGLPIPQARNVYPS